MVEKKSCPTRLSSSGRASSRASGVERASAVRAAGPESVELVLPAGGRVGENELCMMRRIDEQYLKTPCYGSRKMAVAWTANRKRVQRLMRLMGLEAIYPKPRTSRGTTEHRNLPVFAAECGDRAAQPGVVQRHHLRADAARLDVPDGGHGLVQPLRAVVAVVEHAGRTVLPGGLRRHWRTARRRSSTPIRACSTRPWRSRVGWSRRAWRSAWMAAAVGWTTCSWSDCGGR